MKRHAARHENGIPRRRRLLLAAGGMLIALTLLAALTAYSAKPLLAGPALTQLVVSGQLNHVRPQAVRAAVLPVLGNGFFSTDVDTVRAAVETLPWVASAAVRRSWPHTLYIGITEEVPVARWNTDGLMDARAKVFVHTQNSEWARLPLLAGVHGSEQDVLAEYNTFTPLLAPHGLVITQLRVDARGDSTVELNDGIEVRLGREDTELRLERFAAIALPTLNEKLTTVAYVDMRYTNGFAVGWKTAPAADVTQSKEVGPNV